MRPLYHRRSLLREFAANSVQEDQGLFPESELRESSLHTYNLTSGMEIWGGCGGILSPTTPARQS